jgi:hypothetical protein
MKKSYEAHMSEEFLTKCKEWVIIQMEDPDLPIEECKNKEYEGYLGWKHARMEFYEINPEDYAVIEENNSFVQFELTDGWFNSMSGHPLGWKGITVAAQYKIPSIVQQEYECFIKKHESWYDRACVAAGRANDGDIVEESDHIVCCAFWKGFDGISEDEWRESKDPMKFGWLTCAGQEYGGQPSTISKYFDIGSGWRLAFYIYK